jgi:hypothetical protein
MKEWQKVALSMLAGIIGGALGIFTLWSWFFFAAIAGLQFGFFAGSIVLLSPVAGMIGALIGGWLIGRYFEKQEPSLLPRFRDRKWGGFRTRLIRYFIWLVFWFIVAIFIGLFRGAG